MPIDDTYIEDTYIEDSLELNLFFLRIMKEHALFLQLGFTPKNKDMGAQAEDLRMRIDGLLGQTIQAARGYVNKNVMESGELYTQYTEEAERVTQALTGVPIDIRLTTDEYGLGGAGTAPASMQQTADRINYNAANLTRELLQLKERVYNDVITCNMFTALYPLQIDHIIREAQDYLHMLDMLGARRFEMGPVELAEEQALMDILMGEHGLFMDGLLDPSETALKQQARAFYPAFYKLSQMADSAKRNLQSLPMLTRRTLAEVEKMREFKSQGAGGILSCKIRSIIPPLLADHVLREANFYLRILKETLS